MENKGDHSHFVLVSLVAVVMLLAACAPQPWKQDPDVQAAKRDCTGFAEGERYACIERHAVDSLNPDVCRLAGMWVDDMCLQAVYQAAGDPSICDRLYLEGVRPTCRAYYASLKAIATPISAPLALTETYTDTTLGLALDYPVGWQVDAVADGFVHLYAPTPYTSTVGVVRYPQPGGTTMDTVLDGVLQGGEGPRVTYTQALTVGGQPAVRVFFGPPEDWRPDTVILVADPDGGWWTIDGRGELAIFNQIVGTLRWLPRGLPAPTTALSPTPATTPRPTPVPTSNLGKLAYVQGGDIWVKALPDGELQRLTTDGCNREPRWSPSGQWLAYRKDDELWVMRDSGADARLLNNGTAVNTSAWSPVSDTLAYTTRTGSLRVTSAAEWSKRELVAGVGKEGSGVLSMAWSPDGEWLAYARQVVLKEGKPGAYPELYAGLWRICADGNGATELFGGTVVFGAVTAGPNPGAIVAAWSPDSERILFWSDPFSASLLADGTSLNVIPAEGGEPRELVQYMLAYSDFLASSPDGKFVAITEGGSRDTWSHKRIVLVDLSSGELTYLTDDNMAAFSPVWSPDGQHIAYVAMPDRGDELLAGGESARQGLMERGLWVINEGKPLAQQLTDDPAYRDERPLWAANGSYILFARLDVENRASLWLIPAEGGHPQQVVDELTPAPGWFGYYGHVDWDSLFDWWRGPAVQEVSPSHRDQLSAEILDALTAYQPVMDARPTVTTLLSNIARWLNTGGTPSDLAAVLNEASDKTEGAITVTELDLTGDGRDEVVVRIPVMGLPLLVFLNSGGSPAHFEGSALPADFETIQQGRPVDLSQDIHGIEQPSLQLTDLTGDGVPEVLLSYIFAGGSNFRLRPQVFQWHEGDFRLIFTAELVSWVGYSTMTLEPNPARGQDIVLHYPRFYNTGFEAKMIAHPKATQRWRWDPSLKRYALQEISCDLESVLADGGDVSEWELLRVLANEAELLYQAGDLEGALAGYQDVITRAADMERPKERAPHWPAYARFRIAQVQALLGQARAAQAELSALLSDLDEESNLRPLLQTFDETYDPAQPDAALRAMAALHGLRLYEQFYWHDDRPGDLTFPMSMGPLLWLGTPLARYLDAHPEAVDSPPSPAQEQALLHALSELGFPVAAVRLADLNADGLLEVLVTTDETDQHNGPRCTWLLAQTDGRWRSHRLPSRGCCCAEELTEEPLPDGRIVLQWRDSTGEKLAFVWTGETLIEVDPETYEPLPPWPVVGW